MKARLSDSRRKALKTMLAGGSVASVSAIATKEQWMKPVVQSTILPAHAATTDLGFLSSVSMGYSTSGNAGANQSGSLTPSNSPEFVTMEAELRNYSYSLTPQAKVPAGTVGNFNLQMVEGLCFGGNRTNFTPANETVAVAPDGTLPFSGISAGVDNACQITWAVTLTNDSTAEQFLMEITFANAGCPQTPC